MNLFRRLLASAAAALAMHPASQAAPPTAESIVDVDQDSEARHIAEHPMAAVGVRTEYVAAYAGERTLITDDLIERVRSSRRFRNNVLDREGSRMEFSKFIQERTR